MGSIVVAIVGNAAEHSSAILMALRNKMDISIGLRWDRVFKSRCLLRLCYCSRLTYRYPMDLEFTIPEVVAVVASIIIVEQISADGESNWVEGVQLLFGLRHLSNPVLFPSRCACYRGRDWSTPFFSPVTNPVALEPPVKF